MPTSVTLGRSRTSVTPAPLPVAVDHIDVIPSLFSGIAGDTVQLTAIAYDADDNVLTGRPLSWLSSNPAVVTVSSTGFVTAIAGGTATITVSYDNTSTIVNATVAVIELEYLRQLTGGDAAILEWLSARYNVTEAGSIASQWDDARGSVGFGPSAVPSGTGLSVVGTDPETRYMRSDAGKQMQTALTSILSLASDRALVFVGTLNTSSPASKFPLNISDDASGNLLGFDESTINGNDDRVGALTNPGLTKIKSPRGKSAKFRLFIAARSGASGVIQCYPYPAITTAITPATGGDNRIMIGFSTAGVVDERYRAIVVLNRVPTADDITRLVGWAHAYHGAVTGGPTLVVFEGDSITFGTQGSLWGSTSYPAVLMEKAFYAAYDDLNVSVAGSRITGHTGDPTYNMTHSSRAPVIDAMFASSPATKKVLVAWAGTNDITLDGKTGVQAHADLANYCLARKTATPGLKIVVLPMIPRLYSAYGGVLPSQAQSDTYRSDLNTAMAAGFAVYADAYVNLLANGAFNANADFADTTYYDPDGVHLNDTGYQRVADLVDPVLQVV